MPIFRSLSPSIRVFRLAMTLLAVSLLAVACGKKSAEEQLAEAEKLLAERQTARGVIKLKELIRDNPEDPATATGRLMLAKYYTNEGNAQKALEQLEAVVEDFPATDQAAAFALDGVLSIRIQIGDFEGALDALDKALARVPDNAKGNLRLKKASILLQFATISDEPRPEAIEEGTGILRDLMLSEEDGSLRGQAREQLANSYRNRGQLMESNAVYEEYLEKFPNDTVRSHLELAMAVNLMRAGDETKARELFDPTIAEMRKAAEEELDQRSQVQMLQDVARYYELMGDIDEAEEVKVLLMGKVPMTQVALDTQFDIARMHMQAGNEERAIEVLDQIRNENAETQIAEKADAWIQAIRQQGEAAMPAPMIEEPLVPSPEVGS